MTENGPPFALLNYLSRLSTTVSSYYGKSYFPNGRYLESIAVPSYVSQYSATRVSSGCSCLVASSTSTVTAAPTMVQLLLLQPREQFSGAG